MVLFHFLDNRLDFREILLELLKDALQISFHGFHYFNLDGVFKYLRTHELELVEGVLDELDVDQKLVGQVNDVRPLLVQLKFHLGYLA